MGGVGTVALYVGSETVTPIELTQSVLLTGMYGIAAGMLLGTFEAQAMDATEVRTRAEALESERDRLLEFNDLLRHYILNSASLLLGYTEQLRDDIPEGDQHALDVIEEQGRMMERLASNIRSLTSTVFESKTTTVTDLSTLLDRTVSDLGPHASTALTVPNEGPAIRAPENAKNGLFLLIDAVGEAYSP